MSRRTPGQRVSTACGHIIYWTAIIGTILYGHQLGRHRSGTPNTPPPVRPSWAVNLAAFNAANSEISAKILAGLAGWPWGASSKQETA